MNKLTQEEWLASWLQAPPSILQPVRSEPQGKPALAAIVSARKKARLSRQDVATRMKVSPSAVWRLEQALLTGSTLPSLRTLQRYANAVGKRVDVRLV